MREAELMTQVQKFLKTVGIRFFRLNSGKVRVKGGYMNLCPSGTPDILCLDGKILWLEAKQANGKQNPDQVRFQAEAELRGEIYVVVKRLEDAVDAVLQAGRKP